MFRYVILKRMSSTDVKSGHFFLGLTNNKVLNFSDIEIQNYFFKNNL